jgi:hypothetical protein
LSVFTHGVKENVKSRMLGRNRVFTLRDRLCNKTKNSGLRCIVLNRHGR